MKQANYDKMSGHCPDCGKTICICGEICPKCGTIEFPSVNMNKDGTAYIYCPLCGYTENFKDKNKPQ